MTLFSPKTFSVLPFLLIVLVGVGHAPNRSSATEEVREGQWRAMAPGQIEPAYGEIKIASPVVGRVADVLVSVNDQVFAGELLIRLNEADARARLAKAQVQFAMQKRVRNDEGASGKAAQRRKAEDAVVDAENAVFEAQSTLDAAAGAKRRGGGSQAAVDDARAKYSKVRDHLKEQETELRRLEAQSGMPLPTQAEGQLSLARVELSAAQAALENMRIRAPSAGTVLQVNANVGEVPSPSSVQPLLLFGDISRPRVRAELDEADFAEVKIGVPVLIRASAFPDREFSGKVTFIAPIFGQPRMNTRRSQDVKVVEVFAELPDPGPLAVGMKVDVYFTGEGQRNALH